MHWQRLWSLIAKVAGAIRRFAHSHPIKAMILLFFFAVFLIIVFDLTDSRRGRYWMQVFTGNFSPPVEELVLYPGEFGISVLVALLINTSQLVGLAVILWAYLRPITKLLTAKGGEPMKLESLLSVIEEITRGKLLDAFGNSEDTKKKIASALDQTHEETEGYIRDIYGEDDVKILKSSLKQQLRP